MVLRPEVIALSLERPADAANLFRAKVRERHYLGHTTDYRLTCDDGSLVQAHQNACSMPSSAPTCGAAFPRRAAGSFRLAAGDEP